MEVSPPVLVAIALLLAGWTIAAAAAIVRANARTRRMEALRKSLRRMQRMLDMAPAIPMLVRIDGRIEAPERLARWLGLERVPAYLADLAAEGSVGEGGLSGEQAEQLAQHVRVTQKSAKPFEMVAVPPGSKRALTFHGTLADPQVSPGGAAVVWVFDFTGAETELSKSRTEAARARADFSALVGLIEAAPMPMWFRDADMRLQLVNNAYVDAVGAEDLATVIEGQIELLEPEGTRSPAQIAREAMERQDKRERINAVTIDGARRSLRITDLPLGQEGVAGYAIDIEEQQQVTRAFRAFRNAQRAMLDQLSIGVAQFDTDERLTFANRPFRRHFGLTAEATDSGITFTRFLTEAHENGATPQVRDFPEWRSERERWFDGTETREENWPLTGRTHLRIIAQPMPEAGLVLIAEDRTEQLELAATRDTLLQTRAATLDSLFEALAIFSPDGLVQLWNRSFAGTWGLNAELLDTHPNAEELLAAIADNLEDPVQAERIGAVVRAATLDRREKGGQVRLRNGRTLRFAGVPLPDGNGLLRVLDITASQRAEQALRERAIALEEADAVKARFLANMSYEFRTPLTSIGGYAEMLASGAAGELGEQASEYVEAIIESTARLREQVEDVLDMSQAEAGLLPTEKERLDLLAFLTRLVREREDAILTAGLSLDLKGRGNMVIEADPNQLGRAIGNILDNGVEQTPEGGRITVELRRPRPSEGVSAVIVIADHPDAKARGRMHGRGEGIAAGAVAATGVGVRAGAGAEAGVGAAIEPVDISETDTAGDLRYRLSRQLIEAQGGTLETTGTPGAGSVTTIRLP